MVSCYDAFIPLTVLFCHKGLRAKFETVGSFKSVYVLRCARSCVPLEEIIGGRSM